ncbi:MAG: GUN4 domain-containing protein [Xenococcaceae cyanobacterium]
MNLAGKLAAISIEITGLAIAIAVQPYVSMAQVQQLTQALSPEQINLRAKQITVRIDGSGIGSGVIINQSDNIYAVLTNWHVVQNPGEYTVQTIDGRQHYVNPAEIEQLPGLDLAIINFTTNQNYQVAEIGNSAQATEGQSIYFAGYPGELRQEDSRYYRFFSASLVGILPQSTPNGYALVYSGEAFPGMSGGPVLDRNARLIGLHGEANIHALTGAISNYAIPINSYKEAIAQIIPNGTSDTASEQPSSNENSTTANNSNPPEVTVETNNPNTVLSSVDTETNSDNQPENNANSEAETSQTDGENESSPTETQAAASAGENSEETTEAETSQTDGEDESSPTETQAAAPEGENPEETTEAETSQTDGEDESSATETQAAAPEGENPEETTAAETSQTDGEDESSATETQAAASAGENSEETSEIAVSTDNTSADSQSSDSVVPDITPIISTKTGINYTELQKLLSQKKWAEADRQTNYLVSEIIKTAKRTNSRRYSKLKPLTDFSCNDINTINQLWQQYSEGNFGFSSQQQVWLSVNEEGDFSTKTWRNFATLVGWKQGDVDSSTGYLLYEQLTFDPEKAPTGHLPWWFASSEEQQNLIKHVFNRCEFDPVEEDDSNKQDDD